MKITVDQGTLLRELSLLQGIIERKATLPILANVLLTAREDGRLAIAATDLEIGFRSTVEATVEKPGTTTVHARRMHDIVRRLPPGNLGFRKDDGFLHLHTERIRYKLATMDAGQFPEMDAREGKPVATIPAAALADMIKRVMFAITTDDPRYSIGGALWELDDKGITIVATDGHRLSFCRRDARVSAKGTEKLVVPRKAVAELLRLAAEHDDDVEIWHSGGRLFALMGEREVHTSLQEPRFPDYRRVIPEKNDRIVEIDRELLKNAIERVAVLSQEHTHLVKIELEKGCLRVSTQHQQLGEAQEELSIEYSGETFAIGFNAQYVLDYLGVAGSDSIRLCLGEEMGQGLFQPAREGEDSGRDKYIVMPMALG
jgi:DNA polymerase-3 subunit beta